MFSYEVQRRDIERKVNAYFHRQVSIAPRALAALQGLYRTKSPDGHYYIETLSVFEALLTASPASLVSLFRAGIPVEKLFTSGRAVRPAPLEDDTLASIFRGYCENALYESKERPRRCNAATRVLRTQALTETDLLQAFLQTAYTGPRVFKEKVDRAVLGEYATDLGEKLMDAGFVDGDGVTEKWDGQAGTYRARSAAAEHFRAIAERIDSVSVLDPSHDLFQFALWQDSRGLVRVRPFGVGSLGRSSPEYLRDGQTLVFREGILQPASAISRSLSEGAILQFEDMINSASCSESDFQKFFLENPELLAGIDYAQIHPQPVLFSDEGPDLVPDFMLEPIDSKYCDLLELKLPYEELVRRLRNGTRSRFRSVVSEAVAQLSEYRRYFESMRHRQMFYATYGLRAYYPKMILVIGRRNHFKSDIARQELRALLPKDLELWTYDDLLSRARRYSSCVTPENRNKVPGGEG
jgi:hypothetical protein